VPRVDVLLAASGDDGAEEPAFEAGADGFLAKPVTKLAAFQNAILAHVAPDRRPAGPRLVDPEDIQPDAMAYHDDMVAMAEALEGPADGPVLRYITQFLSGVARSARDTVLLDAVDALRADQRAGCDVAPGIAQVSGLLRDRMVQRARI
ncbi:MAG: response regulator, partial [Pseudomonadota bacterium]|nr:response regulator [Pseudomonadota bacterium]